MEFTFLLYHSSGNPHFVAQISILVHNNNMKFKLREGAQHHGDLADNLVPEAIKGQLSATIEKHLLENRGRAVNTMCIDSIGTLNRSHYVEPALFQLAFHKQLQGVANLNDASISIPPEEVHQEARLIFAKERKGQLSEIERQEIEDAARRNAASLIHLEDPKGIILGRNTTEVIGLTYYLANVKDGEIVISDAENASVYQALQYNRDNGNPYRTDRFASFPTWYSSKGANYPPLQEQKRENTIAKFGLETTDNLRDIRKHLDAVITGKTKLLLFSHVVRSTGKEVPVKQICEWAREAKKRKSPADPDIFIVVDGAQAVGNLESVNFHEVGADAYAYSTYKTLGSSPIGILAVDPKNEKIQEHLRALNTLDPANEQVILRGMVDRRIASGSNVDDALSYADLHAFNSSMRSLPEAAREGNFTEIAAHRWKLRKYFAQKLEALNGELSRRNMFIDHSNPRFGSPGDVEVKYRFPKNIWKWVQHWALSGDPQANEDDILKELHRDAIVGEVDVARPTSFILSFFFRGALTWGREDQIWQKLTEAGAFCSCIAFDRFSDQPSVFRVSFGAETTTDDIDKFMSALHGILFNESEQEGGSREQKERNGTIARLTPDERDWRLYPGDGGNPCEISEAARLRESNVHRKAGELLADMYDYRNGLLDYRSYWGRAEAEKAAYEMVKYFPVLWVSAPHIELKANASFPGEPTPLLYATALLDRHLRIDEFPSKLRVPKITAVMNPPIYNEQFEQNLIEHLRQHQPRIVGISNIAEGHHFALKIAQLVKAHSSQSIVVFGGSHEDNIHPAGYRKAAERARAGKRQGESPEVFLLEEDELRKMDELRTLADPAEHQWIDFVISGDAPFALIDFVAVVADNPGADIATIKRILTERKDEIAAIPGSGYLSFYNEKDAQIVDLAFSGKPIERDKLPFIDRRRLSHENRFPVFDYKKTAQVMASVGCKYACEFCCESADSILQDVPNLQPREPENVFKELKVLKEQGYEAVFFDDSTFTQIPSLTKKLLDLMIENHMGLEWGCQTTINDVDEEMLTKMAQAGCTYVYFGFEQASAHEQNVQKARKTKPVTSSTTLPILDSHDLQPQVPWITRFQQVAALSKQKNIRVGTSLQFGLGESEADRRYTIDVVADLVEKGMIPEGSVALNINALYPGTVQWLRAMKERGTLPDYRERLQRDPRFETAHQFGSLEAHEIEAIYQYAHEKLGKALVQ